jgi:peptidoglycan/xylan/chitin deacetylase (PgdA/CDA1 family)
MAKPRKGEIMTKRSTDSHANDAAAPGVSRRGFVTGATTAVGAGLGAMTLAQSAVQAQDREERRRRRGEDNRGGRGGFWPNGARLAIAFSMVIETDADPDPVSKGPDGKNYPNLYAKTAGQYAANEAIPRMLDMFDRRRIKVTSMMCGQSAERNPALAREVAQRGHECGAHGKTHDNQFQMDRETERAFIKDAADMIEKATGQRPVGWNGRGQLRSVNTLSLAQELGFIYHIDDISRDEPFVIPVNDKPFAVVPYTSHLGDIGYFNNRGMASVFAADLKLEFDALYAEAEHKRRMMVVTLHDAVARANRVKVFEDFIAYAQRQRGVWFARSDELAKWALQSPDSIKQKVAT